MAKRIPMKKRKDRKVFTYSASKTKDINVRPVLARGGIRL